jgi:hypothetical protein
MLNTKLDEQTQKHLERRRRFEEWRIRWRWGWTILLCFNLFMAAWEISQKRSQWPGLFSPHAFAQFRNFSSVEWNVYYMFFWTWMLIVMWTSVDRYRREQIRMEQERLMRSEEMAVGVWPPSPTTPAT